MEIGLLYGGAGSAGVAVRNLGHNVVWNYEPRGEHFLKTFSVNFPEANIYNEFKELEKVSPANIIIGQPDCKQFSMLRTRISEKTDFNNTGLWDFIWKIQVLGADAFILENLPKGMDALSNYLEKKADMDFHLMVNPFDGSSMLSDWQLLMHNYNLSVFNVNAKNFIAQSRNRSFMIGIKKSYSKSFKLNLPKDNEIKNVKKVLMTLEDPNSSKVVKNHKTPSHSEERIEGFDRLKYGQSYYGTQNNRRLDPNKPSYAITSHCTQHVHYKFPRVLTVRECARIQGFPDDFIFTGSKTHQYDQVGKAIAVPVIQYILKQVINYLER